MAKKFHEELRGTIDRMVHGAYELTRAFPRDELHGATSQLRRAALSVALNYTEGFARKSRQMNRHFTDIAYGSVKESKYIVVFAVREGWASEESARVLLNDLDIIGRMLWGILAHSSGKGASSEERVA